MSVRAPFLLHSLQSRPDERDEAHTVRRQLFNIYIFIICSIIQRLLGSGMLCVHLYMMCCVRYTYQQFIVHTIDAESGSRVLDDRSILGWIRSNYSFFVFFCFRFVYTAIFFFCVCIYKMPLVSRLLGLCCCALMCFVVVSAWFSC